MNCIPTHPQNPVDLWVALFPTVGEAATAAGVSTEMLRKIRRRGYVSTRDRAIKMAEAAGGVVTAAELLAVHQAAGTH